VAFIFQKLVLKFIKMFTFGPHPCTSFDASKPNFTPNPGLWGKKLKITPD